MDNNIYAPPKADIQDMELQTRQHGDLAGFWRRFTASFIDGILIVLVTIPLSYLYFGPAYFDENTPTFFGPVDFIINYILPFIIVIAFWKIKSATPGKMLLGIKIIDAKHGGQPSTGQFIGRYLGYILSTVVIFLGYFWMLWDKRKQTWHDKLASTLVVRTR